ncbi:hypothetical protein [Microtetraspora fusca]|nr:hypothetical protein [Microtetraspora fusca]
MDEIPHALSTVVAESDQALERRSLRDRILAHLDGTFTASAAPPEPRP